MSITSLSKGGTGKSTLASLMTLALGLAESRVLLIDMGEEGSSSSMLLKRPEPPFLKAVLEGETRFEDAVGLFEIDIAFRRKSARASFYMLPNMGELPIFDSNLEMFMEELEGARDNLDVTLIDLPAFQGSDFMKIIDGSDIVMLVVEPGSARSVAGAAKRKIRGDVLPILNKYVRGSAVSKAAYDYLLSRYGECLVVPLDPALALMSSSTIRYVLGNIQRETEDVLVEMLSRVMSL